MKNIKLGSFKVGEDKIVVADPSFNYGDGETLLLKKVFSGKYFARIETTNWKDCGQIVTSLKICHSDFKNSNLKFERCGVITVDSGQAGFFDKTYFIKNQGGEVGDLNSLYGLSCAVTSSPKQAGTMQKKGVVSSSGFGDGCYNVFVARNYANKIVSAFIEFISQTELEEFK